MGNFLSVDGDDDCVGVDDCSFCGENKVTLTMCGTCQYNYCTSCTFSHNKNCSMM